MYKHAQDNQQWKFMSVYYRFIVRQGRLPVSAMQLSTLLEEALGTDDHAGKIAAKATAAAREQARIDDMAAELDR